MSDYIYAIKSDIKDSLDRYVSQGIPTGDFLKAVLENNLMEAMGRADSFNQASLPEICSYIYNELPSPCHGSPAKVKEWLELKQQEREAAP
jgi:predicted nucleotidyltransferase